MRAALRITGLSLYGFFIALIVYPVMHECGHILAATVCGGRVTEIVWFPLPGILCDISAVSDIGAVFIGLSGVLAPFALSAVTYFKNFTAWYGGFVFKL